MKILYCLAGTFNSGGMERIVVNKANWLAEHGCEVTIITTEQNGRPNFFPLEEGIRRCDLDINYSETNSFGVIKKFFARQKLIRRHRKGLTRIINELKPDIVISTFGNEVSFLPEIKDGSKKIAEIHFSRWYRLQLNRKGIWRIIDKFLTCSDYRVLKKYDKFICLTKEDKYNWGSISNVEVIPNFIDNNSERASLVSKSMIAVGRLSYQKGYERLISAWKLVSEKYPDWTLNIFGGGELKEVLEQQIAEDRLSDKVIIHAPSKQIIEEYKNNSALVLSSRYEGLPMVLLEAMSVGLPLISFACQCGPKDVIKQDVNGFLVEDGDIQGLADAIIKIVEDPLLRKQMGVNSLKESMSYQKETIMQQWVELFNSILNE